jgi:LytTr DNA-binding domain
MPECDGFDVLERAKGRVARGGPYHAHPVSRIAVKNSGHEQGLDPRAFFRILRSIIVNLERVRGLELQESGEYEVVLDSKIRLKLSRRFRKRFQDRLGELSSGR